MSDALVWSYGGGVQSAAIAVLIAQSKLPKPDYAVIADTGREPASTWDYMKRIVEPLLGFKINVAPHDLATVDLVSANGDTLIPAFSAKGKLPTFCSVEWKRRVVHRWLRAQGVESCRLWLGISTDETHRAKPSGVGWVEHHYPLLFDVPMGRAECRQLVLTAGLPDPPRSSCWCCPHRSNAEWRALPADEFARAVELDEKVRAGDSRGGLYLHHSRVPLAEADLSEPQGNLFDACEGGYCWT